MLSSNGGFPSAGRRKRKANESYATSHVVMVEDDAGEFKDHSAAEL